MLLEAIPFFYILPRRGMGSTSISKTSIAQRGTDNVGIAIINYQFLMVGIPPVKMVMNGGWLLTLLYQHEPISIKPKGQLLPSLHSEQPG